MTLVSRYPTFLYEALKLQEAKIPIDLDSQIIQATIDAYQNGWALANYNYRQFTFSHQFTFSLVLIGDNQFPPSPVGIRPEEKQKKVLAISMNPNVTNTVTFALKYRRINGEFQEVIIVERTFNSSAVRDWIDNIMQGSQMSIWVPPGWQLVMDFSATGVAEDTNDVRILWAEIPQGFNIGWT